MSASASPRVLSGWLFSVLAIGCGDTPASPDARAPSVDAAPEIVEDAFVPPGVDAPFPDAHRELDAAMASTDAPSTSTDAPTTYDAPSGSVRLPTANMSIDYQLGGAYEPPSGVQWVSRDRNASIAPGLYNVCYVNGFQIQPDEESFWLEDHADLILRDASGDPVIDADWDEMLIDVSTPEKRAAVAAIVGGWIEGCAAAGFDAIEIDNLDTYARSGGLLSEDDNVAMMRAFSDRAHALGLAIAQKNSAEIVGRRDELGTDFVVAEECNRYDECDVYTDAYGDLVFVIEYRRVDFDRGCADHPGLSIVLRDRNLVTPSAGAYVYDGC
ncbi:MAG: endo alpha-1,4 polygalactosaminidase [Deltaproteobacteria bacterium]|nr:endo alpha-1,4 polygalactosaminidase [Deltaproteobacteria bacterium]